MDLLETWKKLDEDKLAKPVSGFIVHPGSSRHTLTRLRRNYYIKSIVAIVILLLFVSLFFLFDQPLLRFGISIIIAGYLLMIGAAVSMLSKVKTDLPVDGALVEALRHTKRLIQADARFEKIVSLTLYPFACATGFMVGFVLSGGEVMEIITSVKFMSILIVTILIVTPLCYWLASWLHKKTYGQCVNEISEMIADLESTQ